MSKGIVSYSSKSPGQKQDLLSQPGWMCKYSCYGGRCGLSLVG